MAIRKAKIGKQAAWSKDEIVAGVKEFMDNNGRFPKAIEFDSNAFLPSARSIQRTFGGVIGLKNVLGITGDYHRGTYRSTLIRKINLRGYDDEQRVGAMLESRFGEVCVHRQGLAGNTSSERLDFIVFYRGGKFGVDTFFPDSVSNLAKIINIKQGKYQDFIHPIYFVVMNEIISQDEIDAVTANKTIPTKAGIFVMTKDAFIRTHWRVTCFEF